MITFFILLAFLIFLYFVIFYRCKITDVKAKNKLYLFIAFLCMFFIMGFRTEEVGTDTMLYCNIFKKNFDYDFFNLQNFSGMPIYILYNKIVSLFSTDIRAIIITNSFIICLLTVVFIYKNSKNVGFSTILFFTFYHFFSAMNISRQYIAIMIAANSFYYLKNKKIIPYIALILVATLIHNTAIISLLMLPWFFIKKDKNNIIIYLTILGIAILFFDKFLLLFSKIFTHYEMYFSNNLLTEVGNNRKIIITLLYLVIAVIMCLIHKQSTVKDKKEDRELYLLFILNCIAILIGIISLKIMLMTRIEIYFAIYAIITIPNMFDKLKDSSLYEFEFAIIMFIPMIAQLLSNNAEVLPYKNWIMNMFL